MYEIYPDGRVRTDTADDVLALWMRMQAPAETKVSRPNSVEDSWDILMRTLSQPWFEPHKRILTVLKRQESSIDRNAFRALLGTAFTSNNVVGGTIGGIGRYARQAGLDRETIIIHEGTTYRPGPLLREHSLPWDEST